jgi:diguanylate cyclase (GGDEF)-like protein
MTNNLFNNQFIFSIEAIVFGLLSFFLWMYYRGFGRQYVKFWTFSCLSLSIHYLSFSFLPDNAISTPYSSLQLFLLFTEQASNYLFILFLCAGIYCAKEKHYFDKKIINLILLTGLTLGILVAALYLFNSNSLFNRFYIRVSLSQFLFGGIYLASGIYLWLQKSHHFSSRILSITALILGAKHLIFSFVSVAFTTQMWMLQLTHFQLLFDIGGNTILGFSMLVWIYGAERNLATHAISRARYLGQHDALTGLLNREQVLEKLKEVMGNMTENNQLAIFLIDVKRFKFINDTYGLKTGDFILGEIGQRLTQSILMPSVIGRLSGDSFLFALEINNLHQQNQAIEHLHDVINRAYFHHDKEIHITSSIGFSVFPEDGREAEDLMQKSNLALFHAETHQLPTMRFTEQMQTSGRQLLKVEKEIQRAFLAHEFVLYYQPQLNLYTNKLEGVEALIRWQHPEKGLLPPSDFLPDIEALGLNSKLDTYVMEMACETIAQWHEQYKRRVTIAINISAVEFQDEKLVSSIQTLLFKYNIPPKCLDLEITENIVMTDVASAKNTIITLQNMGIKVSIDDFGTGYSSLAYLRSLPIDKIKIDRSFIMEMARNDSDLTIVKSMIELSHGLGKRVLAEGVETVEQLNILRGMGCDAVQGYFISRPIPEHQLAKYLMRK